MHDAHVCQAVATGLGSPRHGALCSVRIDHRIRREEQSDGLELSPEGLRKFFGTVLPHLNEKQRRCVTGAMVVALGRGGQARVVEASGLSSSTVNTATQQVRAGR